MLVGDLITHTQWRPGASYSGARPRLSALLPTFRRGADGTFLKAATSVLEHDADARRGGWPWLEGEVGSRTYAVSLKLRQVVNFVRRLAAR